MEKTISMVELANVTSKKEALELVEKVKKLIEKHMPGYYMSTLQLELIEKND